jgi:aspartyl-tRNA(Asn)/glutamyl-tRNA(Gln) amidotransferase subunit A
LVRPEIFAARKRFTREKVLARHAEEQLEFLTIADAARLLQRRKISPVELTEIALARIERLNPSLLAYLTFLPDQALAAAHQAERNIFRGRYRGPLHGIPICLKDNIESRGVRTTVGSRILKDFVPDSDSAVAHRLCQAGAILLGKTNLHEFAYGITNINPHYGWVRNPWDTTKISGGSSGGSAAALAAGLAYGSIGTDTGGSIRTPSAWCGVVGLKPSYGCISMQGIVPLAPSLDHAGPMGRCVEDVALLLEAVARPDAPNPGTRKTPALPYSRLLKRPIRGMRLGWPVRGCFKNTSPQVQEAVSKAARVLRSQGATLHEISLDGAEAALQPANTVAGAEAAAYHTAAGYYPAHSREYGADVRARLRATVKISAVEYLLALRARDSLLRIFERAFEAVDAILIPTLPLVAPAPDTETVQLGGHRESLRDAVLRFSRPANFTGHPAISVPCGMTREGLPIGLQIIAPHCQEARILRIAYHYEQATNWHPMHPAL